MTTTRIGDDSLDSRELIEREKELRDEAVLALELERIDTENPEVDDEPEAELDTALRNRDTVALGRWLPYDFDELLLLVEVNEEGRDTFGSEWEYGVHLIADGYFETYAEEFARDIGAIETRGDGPSWPNYHIDWAAAAADLQQDYTSMDLEGVTYWGRA